MVRRMLPTAATVVLALAVLGVAGCGDSGSESPSPTPPTAADGATTQPDEATGVVVYFLRDGRVSPVRRVVAATPAVARAAVTALLEGPDSDEEADGLSSAIPDGTELRDLALADGTATVDLDGTFEADGGDVSMHGRVAQIVATLTRFPNIDRVAFRIDGRSTETIGDAGIVVDPPIGRQAIEEQTPQILVESPLPGDTVRSPVRLRGTANVFEATVSIDVRDADDRLLKRTFTTASSGSGTRGTFDTEILLPDREGPVSVVAYESSAKDGTPLHVVRVPLTLVP